MDPELPLGANLAIHVALSVLDLAINAAAGAAAAATGAHVNGDPTTRLVLQTGAWAGVSKSGVLNFTVLISMTTDNIFVKVLMIVLGSPFGQALLVTLAVGQKILGRIVNELLIAAAAAAAPLTAGSVMVEATGGVYSIQAAGWDALGGYTFARLPIRASQRSRAYRFAEFHVCEYKSAAAAGGVFGILVWFMRLPLTKFLEMRAEELQETEQAIDS
ncbi:hypothetical protein DL767_010439 [Monosporascus sp. MG133]|nr:hypothetical protein DL767_010439 [Monosporascus sp. MG133]